MSRTKHLAGQRRHIKLKPKNLKMKTHFAIKTYSANESCNQDEWTNTWCGLEDTESPVTQNEELVTCKNCKKALEKFPVKKFIEQASNM